MNRDILSIEKARKGARAARPVPKGRAPATVYVVWFHDEADEVSEIAGVVLEGRPIAEEIVERLNRDDPGVNYWLEEIEVLTLEQLGGPARRQN